MISHMSHVMTLANSIIGVSVLAMPFCFKQCGIILSILMILLSSTLSKLSCHFLVKSAVMSRRRNFEFLAFHAFGYMGKFLAELSIIGFLMGTCIAFFVVVGDLGPEIVGKILDKNPADIRTSLLVTIGVFIVLPLGLLRNVDSLSSLCTATILFYLCLVLKIMTESTTHMFTSDWVDKVFYWRPSGILQCLPIFSMALFCQTQLFEIYQTMPNVSLEKMNYVVDVALNICTIVYICVGYFGYVAFCTQSFTGNILMSFEASLTSEAIKIGFVLSLAFSFPLVIFPCRASLHSLLFRGVQSHETSNNYIPETRFRWLTFMIVGISLVIGIWIPSIEFVLGLVGSTIGVLICLMFPAAFFISINTKNTNERLLAQAILFIGVWIMILGTYANLYAMEESANAKFSTTTSNPANQLNNVPLDLIKENIEREIPAIPKLDEIPNLINQKKDDTHPEPPIPVEQAVVEEKKIVKTQNVNGKLAPTLSPALKEIVAEIKKLDQKSGDKLDDVPVLKVEDAPIPKPNADPILKAEEIPMLKAEEKIAEIEKKEKKMESLQTNDNLIHLDAIKKEESELAEVGELAKAESQVQQEELKKTLEKHEMEQRAMLLEQKELIKTMKQQREELEKEKKEKLAKEKPVKIVESEVARDEEKKNVNENNEINFQKVEPELEKSRGPILSALVKQASNSNKTNNLVSAKNKSNANELDSAIAEKNKRPDPLKSVKLEEAPVKNDQVSIPIALVMGNKPKQETVVKELPGEKNDDKINVGRDILGNDSRMRREIIETSKTGNTTVQLVAKPENVSDVDLQKNTESKVNSFVKNVVESDGEKECAKTENTVSNNLE